MSESETAFDPLSFSVCSELTGGVTETSKSGMEVEASDPCLQGVVCEPDFDSISSAGIDLVLPGCVTTTSKIEVEAPGLQWVVSQRGLGSMVSGGADSKGSVVHSVELFAKVAACHIAALRENLVVWVDQFEAVVEDSGAFYEIPPLEIVRHHDLLERVWGWERLFPVDDLKYLEEYYRRNAKTDATRSRLTAAGGQHQSTLSILTLAYLGRNKMVDNATESDSATGQQHPNSADHDHSLVTALIYLCRDKEAELVSEWMKHRVSSTSDEVRLSNKIQQKILRLCRKKKRSVNPVVMHDCIKCIMKEAELILERLRKGFNAYHVDNSLSHDIRNQVFCLMKKYMRADSCLASFATSAVLLGITKEAEFICGMLRREGSVCTEENSRSRTIRMSALDVLTDEMDEYLLERPRYAGFCFWDFVDLAVAVIPAWCKKEIEDANTKEEELKKVQVSD